MEGLGEEVGAVPLPEWVGMAPLAELIMELMADDMADEAEAA